MATNNEYFTNLMSRLCNKNLFIVLAYYHTNDNKPVLCQILQRILLCKVSGLQTPRYVNKYQFAGAFCDQEEGGVGTLEDHYGGLVPRT